ncbi:WXG100 family type VII secretion target [Streptomyces sp. NBC_01455]|uniref:WXG100 family type VII secretion target n=1 Tax=Streptomyces sp. NBC_01455 TaxID=2903874 RepID=UPI002E344C93|nr:WXG100 family type VII secretion target [Streptomyces sp. NBC_01455]
MPETTGSVTSFQGSDGVLYNSTPQDLKEKAQDIRNTQETVQGELGRLKSYVVSLEGVWQGIAASTFQQLMSDWDTHAAQLQDALLGISQGLDSSADNYIQGEHVNLANLNKVHLPAARLS